VGNFSGFWLPSAFWQVFFIIFKFSGSDGMNESLVILAAGENAFLCLLHP